MKIRINGSVFSIRETNGPIRRSGKDFAVRIRYRRQEIELLRTLPEDAKKLVLAAAISEASRLFRIPLIWPKWGDAHSFRGR